MIRTLLSAFALFVAAPLAACAQVMPGEARSSLADATLPDAEVVFGGPEPLAIETADGTLHRFTVEIADTPRRRVRGLMHREAMDADAGMLFNFEQTQIQSIWMRNTLIPLDILYVYEDGEIAKIIENAQPLSERSLWSDFPVRYVVELNGGLVQRIGAEPGDRIRHAYFGDDLAAGSEAEAANDNEAPEAGALEPDAETNAETGEPEAAGAEDGR